MHCLFVPLAFSGLLACTTPAISEQWFPRDDTRLVIAQAGSIGGSIGKQGKSATGSDDSRAPAATTPAPKKRKATAARSNDDGNDEQPQRSKRGGGNCGRVAGNWTSNGWWNALYGRGDVVLRADGSARHNSGIVGTWTCGGGHFVMDWKNWAHAEGSMSDDGNTITFDNGGTMTRGR